jgi:hypothetical protein
MGPEKTTLEMFRYHGQDPRPDSMNVTAYSLVEELPLMSFAKENV